MVYKGVWGLKFNGFKAVDLGCMEVMENQIERKHEMDRDLRAQIWGFGMN